MTLNYNCYSKSYEYVPLPLPSRYRPVTVLGPTLRTVTVFGPTLPNVTHRDGPLHERYPPLPIVTHRYRSLPTVTHRYPPLPTVTHRYRTLPLLALQGLLRVIKGALNYLKLK